MFRKFFYENSIGLEDVAHFVEVTTPDVAYAIGFNAN